MIDLHVFSQRWFILEIYTTNAAGKLGGRMFLGGVHLQSVHIGEQLLAEFASVSGVLLLACLVMRLELLKVNRLKITRHAFVDLCWLASFLGTCHQLLLLNRCDGCVLAQLLLWLRFFTAWRLKYVRKAGLQWIDRSVDGAHLSCYRHLFLNLWTIAGLTISSECLASVKSLHFGGRLLDRRLRCMLSSWRIVWCDSVFFVDQIHDVCLDALKVMLESVHVIEKRHTTFANDIVYAYYHHKGIADNAPNLVRHLCVGNCGNSIGKKNAASTNDDLIADIAMFEGCYVFVLTDAHRLLMLLGSVLLYCAWLRWTSDTNSAA